MRHYYGGILGHMFLVSPTQTKKRLPCLYHFFRKMCPTSPTKESCPCVQCKVCHTALAEIPAYSGKKRLVSPFIKYSTNQSTTRPKLSRSVCLSFCRLWPNNAAIRFIKNNGLLQLLQTSQHSPKAYTEVSTTPIISGVGKKPSATHTNNEQHHIHGASRRNEVSSDHSSSSRVHRVQL